MTSPPAAVPARAAWARCGPDGTGRLTRRALSWWVRWREQDAAGRARLVTLSGMAPDEVLALERLAANIAAAGDPIQWLDARAEAQLKPRAGLLAGLLAGIDIVPDDAGRLTRAIVAALAGWQVPITLPGWLETALERHLAPRGQARERREDVTLLERLGDAVRERSLDLSRPVPMDVQVELARELQTTKATIGSTLPLLRRRLGIQIQLPHELRHPNGAPPAAVAAPKPAPAPEEPPAGESAPPANEPSEAFRSAGSQAAERQAQASEEPAAETTVSSAGERDLVRALTRQRDHAAARLADVERSRRETLLERDQARADAETLRQQHAEDELQIQDLARSLEDTRQAAAAEEAALREAIARLRAQVTAAEGTSWPAEIARLQAERDAALERVARLDPARAEGAAAPNPPGVPWTAQLAQHAILLAGEGEGYTLPEWRAVLVRAIGILDVALDGVSDGS